MLSLLPPKTKKTNKTIRGWFKGLTTFEEDSIGPLQPMRNSTRHTSHRMKMQARKDQISCLGRKFQFDNKLRCVAYYNTHAYTVCILARETICIQRPHSVVRQRFTSLPSISLRCEPNLAVLTCLTCAWLHHIPAAACWRVHKRSAASKSRL